MAPRKPKSEPDPNPDEPEQTKNEPEQTSPEKSQTVSAETLRRIGMDAESMTMATETLAGDVRDFVLDMLRHEKSPLPWNVRPEAEQRGVVERVSRLATVWTGKAVRLIAGAGRQVMAGKLVQVQIKDAIRAQVDFLKSDPLRHDLMDAAGAEVLLVVSDASAFQGARGEVEIRRDQPDLLDALAKGKQDAETVTANEAMQLGSDAYHAGQTLDECPFVPGSNESLCWQDGWNEARDANNNNNEGTENV
jgi:ribosome modulation factor